jgi:hypothetical protein
VTTAPVALSLSFPEAVLLRQSLRNVIAANEGTLERIRKMSQLEASRHEVESTMAANRIVIARGMLARMEDGR